MPSSTSSSSALDARPALGFDPAVERQTPDRPWPVAGVAALLLTLLALGAWEANARRLGYGPTFHNDADHWVRERRRVTPTSVVAVGSSRILFDLVPDVWEEVTGARPIQLARVGTVPRPLLHDLATDPTFHGTVLVGVTPGLYFAPGGPPLDRAKEVVERFRQQTPSQRFSFFLDMSLLRALASLNPELTLRALLESVPLPPRPGYRPPPRDPSYFGRVHEDRSITMTERMQTDVAYQREMQQIWLGLLGAAPPMPPEAILQSRDKVLEETRRDVDALRARGGRVVFIQFPATGGFLESERAHQPRAEYWDRLLAATGAPGVHFEDHPELSGYDCPEWSHLRPADAERFTRALAPLVEAALAASPP